MENWFKSKSKKELDVQSKETSKVLETEILPINQEENPFSLSLEDIKEKYPERYKAYLQILISIKSTGEIQPEHLEELRTWIASLNNLDAYIEDHKQNKDRVLRRRQFTVFEDIRSSLEQGKKEGFVKLPTGVGKTVLFAQVVSSMDLKTLILVPSKLLVNQTIKELKKRTKLEHGRYFSDEKDYSKQVTVMTYQSLIQAMKDGIIKASDFGLMILDEAHKSLGEKTVEALDGFDCIKLGFSATPEYSPNRKVENLLEHQIHEMTIVEGVQEGLINRFKSIFALTDIDLSSVPIQHGEYNQEHLEKVTNNPKRNLSALKLYREMFDGKSAVAYCSGVSHATDLAEMFNEVGISAEVISGKTSLKDRRRILGDPEKGIVGEYESGKIKVLCNAKILVEGFDAPIASVALNLHPTLSRVDAEQRAGRVLRLDENNPDKWAYIVEFLDKNSRRAMVTFPEIAQVSEMTYENPPEFVREHEARKRNSKDSGDNKIDLSKEINIEGLRIVVDAKEVYSISKDFVESRGTLEIPPEGWMNLNEINKKFGFSRNYLQKIVDSYRSKNPEYFSNFFSLSGSVEYFSPELITKLGVETEEHRKSQEIPLGWMNANEISKEYSLNYSTITNFAKTLQTSNPGWFMERRNQIGLIAEYYHPELIKKIIETYGTRSSLEKAPQGWVTIRALSQSGFKIGSAQTVNKKIEKYLLTNPEWFGTYMTTGNHITRHIHPDLVKILKKEGEEIKPPEGWMTASSLRYKLKVSDVTITKYAESFRKDHPKWFGFYFGGKGSKSAEHFDPELVKLIEEKFKSVTEAKEAPVGWVTTSTLSAEKIADYETINKYVNTFRESNPNWFDKFKTKTKVAEHFDPELVKKIKEHFGKIKATPTPEQGWDVAYTVAKEVGRDTVKIKKLVEPYRKTNPGWFKKFRIQKSRIEEHYAPELLKIIRQYFNK